MNLFSRAQACPRTDAKHTSPSDAEADPKESRKNMPEVIIYNSEENLKKIQAKKNSIKFNNERNKTTGFLDCGRIYGR